MKLNTQKNKGSTIASVIASVAIGGALLPQVVDLAQKAAAAENAGRLNSAVSFYTASGGRVPLRTGTKELIELLQSDKEIEGFMARGPWIHQQSEPKFTTVGWRVVRDLDSGDFRVIHSKEAGVAGFVGF